MCIVCRVNVSVCVGVVLVQLPTLMLDKLYTSKLMQCIFRLIVLASSHKVTSGTNFEFVFNFVLI